MRIDALYIHIPFCLRKCNYCDFVSFPRSGREELFAAYHGLLEQELELWRREADLTRISTVYFGGGTPSLLAADTVSRLLGRLPAVTECTLEANPETVDLPRLAAFRQAGIDRLSLGVQSFDAELLRAMGRGHDGEQAARAVSLARQAGFDNISLDLIYGLPGQTVAQWRDSLERAAELAPEHISLYGLTIHENTPWGEALAAGRLEAPDDDLAADMLELALDFLPEQGFVQYEIANFARPGRESRHNCAYWQRDNYLGLGYCRMQRNCYTLIYCRRGIASHAQKDRVPVIRERRQIGVDILYVHECRVTHLPLIVIASVFPLRIFMGLQHC